jgi:hypothetical protein
MERKISVMKYLYIVFNDTSGAVLPFRAAFLAKEYAFP